MEKRKHCEVSTTNDFSLQVEAILEGRSFEVFKAPSGFTLKSGEHLDGGFLAYKTYGQLNADRSNAILHPTSFDAVHWELEFNIGPGKMLDTNKFCVIVVNLIGNGVSFSPSSCSPGQFPKSVVTLCDNVRLQAMMIESLGISKLALIYGYSMGAMQALHWGVMFPDRVLRIAAVCGAAKAHDFNIVFLDSLKATLLTDPGIQEDSEGRLSLTGSCKQGLKAFARIYAGWALPMEFYRQELWRQSARDGKPFESREDFVVRSYEGGFANGNPLNLIAQLDAWKAGDVSKASTLPPGSTLADALGRITARVYFMPSTTDAYFTVAETEEEAKSIPNCRFVPISSLWGHRAGDTHRPGQDEDAKFLADKVEELLAEVPAL